MEYIYKRLQVIKDDSFLQIMIGFAIVFDGFHCYQFISSNFDYKPLLRLIMSGMLPMVIFFFGRKGLYWEFYVFANVIALYTTFQNYTAFVIITIFTMLNPKMKMPAIVLYVLEIVIIATLRDKTPVHIAIHFCNCMIMYYTLNYLLKPSVLKNKLELTTDETMIIEELLQGKQQKEIIGFSANTVTNKLKQARERNHIATTEELLQRYLTYKNKIVI